MKNIVIYDSTLRDGAQSQGISFTVSDKIKIVELLDDFGVDYIEAGNPGSNPKDMEFFDIVKRKSLKNSKLIAFGSTRRANTPVEKDANVSSLLLAETEYVAVFGKSWDFHVSEILRTTLDENLNMIYDTINYLKNQGKKVVFDAEHFFDGFMENPEYALKTIQVAYDAGADSICLCDTKGGMFPMEIYDITKKVVDKFDCEIGIHAHNDNGMAVANSIMAVEAGAVQVQGTINGYGERCGNANLCTILPNLQFKKGIKCVEDDKMKELTVLSRRVSEIANAAPDERAPYVGRNAFAHKAGMHSDAVCKNTRSYEIIDPEVVGNERVLLLSEVAGRSALIGIVNEVDPTIDRDSDKTKEILEKLKEMESKGYKYEGAEGSLKLLILKTLGLYKPSFRLIEFKVIVNEPSVDDVNSSALIKIEVDGQEEITAAEGDGPVNALDKAVRKALERFYPEVKEMKLTDYKVRVLDSNSATAAKVRVIIESSDGNEVWSTIGVSTDIIDASWIALVDSIEYKLNKK
ncbi:citramalate synthase [Thermoanaerobacterium saccharolyticum]|uniref:citramalate synthase n=1 Tax=Thermoanaerobacterium saccharolyticum TaxID=28896 RepID=UPI0005EDD355